MTTESSRGLLARRWQLAVPVVAAAAGVLFVASAVSSGGTDLRASGTDLEAVVQQRANTVDDLRQRLRELQAEVDSLGVIVGDDSVRDLRSRVAVVGADAGITPVSGPGLVVTRDDSPLEEAPEGFDPNELVVHQQDIQAFVNAMWAGGATAVSLQGQRLVSSTGIKCVGNTVVLEGVPYAPPYVIEALGDSAEMLSVMADAEYVDIYRQYVEAVGLGLSIEDADHLDLAGYTGLPVMDYAQRL